MMRTISYLASALAVTLSSIEAHAQPASLPKSSDYLYLWTGSKDTTKADFLAVIDIRQSAGRFGTVVATVPVPGHANWPHHTEHAMPVDGRLFVNGFGSGQSFIFDMTNPAKKKSGKPSTKKASAAQTAQARLRPS